MKQRIKYSKILVAEDDVDVLESYKEIFKIHNYHFTTATNGDRCIDIYKEEFQLMQSNSEDEMRNDSPFDVVILDYKMPKKDGLQVAKEILAMNPRQRIMFASAYVEGTLANSIKHLNKVVEIIQKPFELQSLIDMIEDKEAYAKLEKLNVSVHNLKDLNPTHEQIQVYLQALKMIQKHQTI